MLFLGAWSFGIGELLGLDQMRAWQEGRPSPAPRLKTGWLYDASSGTTASGSLKLALFIFEGMEWKGAG
jgi:hypothetical protein